MESPILQVKRLRRRASVICSISGKALELANSHPLPQDFFFFFLETETSIHVQRPLGPPTQGVGARRPRALPLTSQSV